MKKFKQYNVESPNDYNAIYRSRRIICNKKQLKDEKTNKEYLKSKEKR
jgi:accessory colonization factor AcfC